MYLSVAVTIKLADFVNQGFSLVIFLIGGFLIGANFGKKVTFFRELIRSEFAKQQNNVMNYI